MWSTGTEEHSQPLPQYSNLLEGPIVVMGNSLHQVHLSTRNATDRSVPVVSNPHVQVPGVEVLKVLIEWDKILQGTGKNIDDFFTSCLSKSLHSEGVIFVLWQPAQTVNDNW